MKALPLWKLDPKRVPGPLGALLRKEAHLWVHGWLEHRARLAFERKPRGERHVLFALCDHYEPLHGGVDSERGRARVARWRNDYPKMASRFRDATGRPPRHSYFFPGEQYERALVEPLGELCELGLGEVEVHLHHDGDTRATLRRSLEETLAHLMGHGLISRGARGEARWAFIHGNWCLANARRDGRWCGVDDEMELLYELGCFADFTFPSAPDQCQPALVNCIYYPRGDVRRRRAYEDGERAFAGMGKRDRLLLIEGPIALSLRAKDSRGKGRLRIESAALDASDPPDRARVETWLDQAVRVEGRSEWTFVKVHTHGAPEANASVMLDAPIAAMHEALAEGARARGAKLHYVTAREMYNVARAAMDDRNGEPPDFFDYEIPPPPRAAR
ncbi:MAG: hypothetical protein IPG50_24530 [Myxococcales bacterium]|nr:hypothetical protein [Myxococcales bacterium]